MRIWSCSGLGLNYLGGCAVVMAETEDKARELLHVAIMSRGGNIPASDLDLVEFPIAEGANIIWDGEY